MKFNNKQYKKLINLLKYLKDNNIYWNQKLKNYSDDIINIDNIDEIYKKIDVINKSDILDDFDIYLDKKVLDCFDGDGKRMKEYLLNTNDLNKNHDKKIVGGKTNFMVETTSGTTGKPFPIVKNTSERIIAANYLLKCRRKHYSEATINNAFLLAHEVDEYLKSTDYLNEKSDMKEVVDYFIEKKPKWVFVTANTIKRFTRAIKKFNKESEIGDVGVEFIEVTGAKLEDTERREIEDIFKAPIRNQYGCREVWNIAYECKCKKLHINDSNLLVDLVDENGNMIYNENEVGEVVITSLYNKTTPFIKYYLGDYASISYQKCECGNTSPILNLHGGRKTEKLINTPYFGTAVFRRVLRVLYFNKGIRYEKIKIIQDDQYHLSIYLYKCSDFDLFKEKFIEISSVMIENFDNFKVDFHLEYPFPNENRFLKEVIFISKII